MRQKGGFSCDIVVQSNNIKEVRIYEHSKKNAILIKGAQQYYDNILVPAAEFYRFIQAEGRQQGKHEGNTNTLLTCITSTF